MRYYIQAFKNYAKSDGRASRKEFWWFILFHYLFMFVFSFVDALFGWYPTIVTDYYVHSFDYGYLTIIYLLATISPAICVQVRRLHDIGKSGYWYFIGGMPIVGLYLFYLNLKPSQPTVNAYGSPVSNTSNAICGIQKQTDNSNRVRFCRKCGYELMNGSDFCSQCGTGILEQKYSNIDSIQKFNVVTFDTSIGKMRTETRTVDIEKFPPEKFAENNTYYAIETIKEDKKVRIYCTREKWEKQIEINKPTEEQIGEGI